MSALLAHAKAFEALADCLWYDGNALAKLDPVGGQFLQYMASAHKGAAERLREQAKAEALEGATGDHPS